ncbi:hypothetical protein [Nostoc sp.]|uniref:hypothetical protein n=1 Tax=Nostoc sp. TaxID=1180 RepID=UPI002FF60127
MPIFSSHSAETAETVYSFHTHLLKPCHIYPLPVTGKPSLNTVTTKRTLYLLTIETYRHTIVITGTKHTTASSARDGDRGVLEGRL